MPKIFKVSTQPLDPLAFRPYGRMIAPLPGQTPDFQGEGWRCWVSLAELDSGIHWQAGMVQGEKRPLVMSEMERHLERPECVFALDRAVVQTVAFSRPDTPGVPDERALKAFVIQPGQGVMMDKGVWHGVGLPAGDESIRYLFLLGSDRFTSESENSGWVPFASEVVVQISH